MVIKYIPTAPSAFPIQMQKLGVEVLGKESVTDSTCGLFITLLSMIRDLEVRMINLEGGKK